MHVECNAVHSRWFFCVIFQKRVRGVLRWISKRKETFETTRQQAEVGESCEQGLVAVLEWRLCTESRFRPRKSWEEEEDCVASAVPKSCLLQKKALEAL